MKKVMICLTICLVLCSLLAGCSSDNGVGGFSGGNRVACPSCGGSGWQQIVTGTDPITGIPNWTSVGCGGCGGSGYIG